jgi:hypothetical protein
MNRNFSLISLLLLSSMLFSCARKLTEEIVVAEKLQKRKEKELVAVLDSLSLVKPKTFYSKLSVDFKDTTTSIAFKTSLKIVTDSAVNAIITYAKIPIVTAMITTDSIIVVNKRDKCFERETLSYIKDKFGIDFTYQNIEELFLGRPLDYNVDQKYFVIHDPYNYSISSHKKRERKRLDRKPKEDIVINYILTKDAKELSKTTITSPSDSTEIIVDYLSRKLEKGIMIPYEVQIRIMTPRNNMFIKLEYEKVEVDEPQELLIIIPEKYEKCN